MIKLESYLEKPLFKFILWFLTGLFIVSYGILSVNAASISEARLFGHRLDDEWSISPNGSTIGTADYFLFTDGSVPNYLYADVCTTGNAPTVWVTGFGGNTRVSPDTKVYKVNKPCSVSGYSADVYRFTFYITSFDDAGNGNLGLQFNTRLFNNTDYNTFFRLLSITYSNSLSYSDIDLSNQQNIIDQNNQIISEQQNTTNAVEDLNDNLTDSDVTGVEDSFEQFEGFLEDNSTITQLITLPITLYSSILNNVGGSCQPFNLGSLYGENLVLPCVNIGNYLGSTLWGMIDLIISGFAVYFIAKKLIKVFNNFSSMKDGDVIDD
jgi:hypothetical protein